ncbi:D-alanyl-D-alanine carboxypeptidase family protein [Bacillus sp. CGMCC 1.16607]|uniref:D-alanyl-D-alanine carboxypeptidase family protein n=1 Tax=Bacillus sp. CGMCC 1.16607 TaxID=3351842 RepID=UPI0036389AE1
MTTKKLIKQIAIILILFVSIGFSNMASASTLMYTTTLDLNIRTGSTPSYQIIGTVKKGTRLNVTGKASNGWYIVDFKGKKGFVSNKYVKVATGEKGNSIQVVTNPESVPVLVNKQNKLPEKYTPKDLVYTTIPFTFKEKSEKKKMRKEAAVAIARLFEGANKQGIRLLGVSGYRSHSTQTVLFNYYVKKDGYEKARTYSALPGTSEHETGLAIDVTGGNGKCPAQDCFGKTKEAKWLQFHAYEYGFIIRYPKGKDSITGYKYEPWHLRYVGKTIAKDLRNRGITLEEYYSIPVNK